MKLNDWLGFGVIVAVAGSLVWAVMTGPLVGRPTCDELKTEIRLFVACSLHPGCKFTSDDTLKAQAALNRFVDRCELPEPKAIRIYPHETPA